jgi:uncharacterized protein YuzE
MADIELSPELISQLIAFPSRQTWIDYDEQADVLYISFRKPQQANDSVMEDDGKVYHYHDDDLVGVTVMNASKQMDKA